MNVQFILEQGFSALKAEQQDLIDLAKLNLAQPVKFKLSGIIKQYTEKLRKRELERLGGPDSK